MSDALVSVSGFGPSGLVKSREGRLITGLCQIQFISFAVTATHVKKEGTRVLNLSQVDCTIEHMFGSHPQTIPTGLDQMEPGPFLAAILSTIDFDRLSGYDRVVALRAVDRMVSHYSGRKYEALAAVAEANSDHEMAVEQRFEAAETEVSAALRLTRRSADTALGLAENVTLRLPQISRAMTAGDIDLPRARVMVNETAHLSIETARDVIDEIIDKAPRMTTGQLRALIRRLCIETNPSEAGDRYQKAVKDRCLIADPTEFGTTDLLILNLAPERAAAATDYINYLAKNLCGPNEHRTMDQLRADCAVDLLVGNPVAAPTRHGVVDIHVDLTTLARLSEVPGELAGYGPVVADIARQVADNQHQSEWRYTVHHPESAQIIGNGTTRKRSADARQTRHVQARHDTCIFPGCRMPATACDLDHCIPYSQGGPTCPGFLRPLCRYHHTQRHAQHWTYESHPDGDHTWTSPLGHYYTTSGRAPP